MNDGTNRYYSIFAILAALAVVAATAFAAPPKTISYQGFLKDGTGAPITRRTYITFSLYSTTSGVPSPRFTA